MAPCAELFGDRLRCDRVAPGPARLPGVLQHERQVDRCEGVTIIELRQLLREQFRVRLRVPGAGRRVVALRSRRPVSRNMIARVQLRRPLRMPARRRLVATVEIQEGRHEARFERSPRQSPAPERAIVWPRCRHRGASAHARATPGMSGSPGSRLAAFSYQGIAVSKRPNPYAYTARCSSTGVALSDRSRSPACTRRARRRSDPRLPVCPPTQLLMTADNGSSATARSAAASASSRRPMSASIPLNHWCAGA